MSLASDVGWRLSVYRAAGEASGTFRYSWSAEREPPSGGGDPERSGREAARRARAKLRRYCAANGLNRFGTLTYAGAGQHDPYAARAEVAEFWRRLRSALGGEALPYAWVPEWHKSGHGLHFHFAVGRFVPRGLIEDAWGRGFIKIKLLSDLPVGAGEREGARIAARYLAKYVGKSFGEDRIPGLHRYEVAQGFQPQRVIVSGATAPEALAAASELMGDRPGRVWDSGQAEGWQGPPAVWASWR